MTMIRRWNPVREMVEMQRAMDRFFDETWRNGNGEDFASSLALDVTENDNAYAITANLPGMNPDDIEVTFHDGVLTISGETKREEEREGDRALVRERSYGKFTRSLRLPQPVDADAIDSSYDNGVLTLTLPKSAEAQPRRISVKSNKVLEG